jgi:hypothetical protein
VVARQGRVRLGRPSPDRGDDRAERVAPRLRSTIGRPRVLTERQIRRVLAAYTRFLAWKALRQTVQSPRQLAEEFGVSYATIRFAIHSREHYKQASPERRAAELRRRRRAFARLRAKGLLRRRRAAPQAPEE